MTKAKTQTITLTEITATFYVRRELNEGRVSQLIKLAQAGVILPPITVWWNEAKERYELIDGRHRLEMAKRLEYPSIKAEILNEPDLAARVGLAVAANADGPLTPTDEDYSQAIATLMDAGVSRKRILDTFPLPKSYTLKLFHDTQNRRKRVALNKAAAAVANANVTAKQAAEQFGVEESELRDVLHPKGAKREKRVAVSDFTGGFSGRFRSFSQANWANYRQLLKRVAASFKQASSGLEDWRARFEVKVSGEEIGALAEEADTESQGVTA